MTKYFDPTPLPVSKRYAQWNHWHEGEGFFGTGWTGTVFHDDVWRTKAGDPAGEWGRLFGHKADGSNLFLDRGYSTAQSFNHALHFLFGFRPNEPGNVLGDHHAYIGGGDGLARFHNPPCEAREAFGLAASPTEMLLAGGLTYALPHDPGATFRCFDDLLKFDLYGNWTVLFASGAPWGKLRSFGFEYLDGYWHVFGGFDAIGNRNNRHWMWDGVNVPVQLPDAPWSPRGAFWYCVANGRLWLMGGNDGGYSKQVWSWGSVVEGWVQHADAPWDGCAGTRLLVKPSVGGAPDIIFKRGGMSDTPRIFYGNMYSLNTSTINWTHEINCTLNT